MKIPETCVFDSWALLAFLQREETAASRVKTILAAAEGQQTVVFMSLMNVGEVFYIVGKRQGEDAAEETLQELYQLPIKVVAPDSQTIFQAARLKMHHALAYADAFAVKLAQDRLAVLVTGDPELLKLSKIVSIEALKRQTR